MEVNRKYTKQNIQKRMQKLAVRLLGLKHANELDPIILLIIQSLGEEAYMSARELFNIESRIIEKLSDTLVIDTTNSTFPAHGILHAAPLDSKLTITPEMEFIYENKQEGKDKLKFHPLCTTVIREARVRYQIANGVLYEIDTDFSREAFFHSRELESRHPSTCWLGLETSVFFNNLKDVSFYFDFQSVNGKEKYLKLLPYTIWKLNDKPINIEQGIYHIPQTFENQYAELFSSTNPFYRIKNSIMRFYEHHFLTPSNDAPVIGDRRSFPETLRKYYPETITNEFSPELLWLEIDFPPSFDKTVLEQMSISLNAFPAANMYLRKIATTCDMLSPLIPLTTDNGESFISVGNVMDSSGKKYYDLSFGDFSDKEYKTYNLHKGGAERYDKRDAKNSLTDLANRIEEQIDFYSNQNSTKELSKEIRRQIYSFTTYLQQLVKSYTDKRTSGIYLIIDELPDDEVFFVEYYVTDNDSANDIPIYTIIEHASESGLEALSIRFLTTTTGGKALPSSLLGSEAYHDSLNTRTLLVTDDDIIQYCTSEFKEVVSEAYIDSGYLQCAPPDEGFLLTTDVYVTLRETTRETSHPKIITSIRKKLIENSPVSFNYRVFIKKDSDN